MTRQEFLADALQTLLSRLSPPLSIRANPGAQSAEVAAMLKSISRAAPPSGYGDWWPRFEESLMRRAKTRAWPILSEIEAAAASAGVQDAGDGTQGEDAAVARMADWFGKFNNQLPGHGRPSRTAALIRMGVLPDERTARFHGFDLDEAQTARAMSQQPCRAEEQHHRRVSDALADINEAMAEQRVVKGNGFAA